MKEEMGYVLWGVTKEGEIHLSSPFSSRSSEVQVHELNVAISDWLTTEITSAFLERAVAWQLKLRKTGLEMRCYF